MSSLEPVTIQPGEQTTLKIETGDEEDHAYKIEVDLGLASLFVNYTIADEKTIQLNLSPQKNTFRILYQVKFKLVQERDGLTTHGTLLIDLREEGWDDSEDSELSQEESGNSEKLADELVLPTYKVKEITAGGQATLEFSKVMDFPGNFLSLINE